MLIVKEWYCAISILSGAHPMKRTGGFLDETWWSRLSQPTLHAWSPADQPQRLIEQTVASDDPDPKGLACYGLYIPAAPPGQQMWLRGCRKTDR
jgi:CRISPR/Cas system endoribonuclease Cas6 (RAMP superfamily)